MSSHAGLAITSEEMSRDSNGSIQLGSFRVVRPEKNGLMAEQVVIQVRDMIG